MSSILITGVSSGIGRSLASRYAADGWDVTGTVRDPASAEELPGVRLEELDLARPGSAARLAERVLAASGCPDVVVNNAGVLQFGPLELLGQEELERLYQVNVFGQLELARAFIPAMRERGSGVIANITSVGGTLVFPFFGGYNSTKWALEAASEGLWHELRPFGIRVKAIEPGFVETAIWGKVLPPREAPMDATGPYAVFLQRMREFETSITSRTSSQEAASQIMRAIADPSDRLRYPVAAYARMLVNLRRLVGPQAFIRFFHERWMGRDNKRG